MGIEKQMRFHPLKSSTNFNRAHAPLKPSSTGKLQRNKRTPQSSMISWRPRCLCCKFKELNHCNELISFRHFVIVKLKYFQLETASRGTIEIMHVEGDTWWRGSYHPDPAPVVPQVLLRAGKDKIAIFLIIPDRLPGIECRGFKGHLKIAQGPCPGLYPQEIPGSVASFILRFGHLPWLSGIQIECVQSNSLLWAAAGWVQGRGWSGLERELSFMVFASGEFHHHPQEPWQAPKFICCLHHQEAIVLCP